MGNSVRMPVMSRATTMSPPVNLRRSLCLAVLLCLTSACSLLAGGTVLYDQQGSQVGVQTDPTVHRGPAPMNNGHPAQLTPEEVRLLLGSLMVSGWSGTIVGILEQPRPVPVFTEMELNRIATPIAAAFQQAAPTERVFFSSPNHRRPTVKNGPPARFFYEGGISMSCSRITPPSPRPIRPEER